MKNVKLLFVVIIVSTLFSCRPKTNPNEWVVSTFTCWNEMTVSKAGDVYPRLIGACSRGLVLPATYMAAEFDTDTKIGNAQDGNRLAAKVSLSYQWRISDPIIFIGTAKSLVTNTGSNHEQVNVDILESVENAVVDKMVINLIREYTPTLDPRNQDDLDELKMEKDLQVIFDKQLAVRGVSIANLSLNVDLSDQVEEAQDVIGALNFYRANGEEELGRRIIEAQAGAPTIIVNGSSQE